MLMNTHGLLLGSRGRTAQVSPAFLLLPNTLKSLIPCDFWFMCCFGLAPPGKPRPVSPFSFSQSHSVYYKCSLHRKQRAQTTHGQKLPRTEKQSQRERDRGKHPQSFKVQKVSCWSRQSPSAAIQNPKASVLHFVGEHREWQGFCLFSF